MTTKKTAAFLLAFFLCTPVFAASSFSSMESGDTGEVPPASRSVLYDDTQTHGNTSQNKNEVRRLTDREIIISKLNAATDLTPEQKAYYMSVLNRVSDEELRDLINRPKQDLMQSYAILSKEGNKDAEFFISREMSDDSQRSEESIYKDFLIGEQRVSADKSEKAAKENEMRELAERTNQIVARAGAQTALGNANNKDRNGSSVAESNVSKAVKALGGAAVVGAAGTATAVAGRTKTPSPSPRSSGSPSASELAHMSFEERRRQMKAENEEFKRNRKV